jgi:hypothetical protein
MKTKEIVALLKDGKKPVVKILGALWDDAWGEKGMLARIVSFKENHADGDPMVELEFDYNENKAHNLSLQSHEYFLRNGEGKGTAIEAGVMKEDNIPVELADSPILALYTKSGSNLSYVQWLESKMEELVPECMKDWKEGI